jgi:hypothetical protein
MKLIKFPDFFDIGTDDIFFVYQLLYDKLSIPIQDGISFPFRISVIK